MIILGITGPIGHGKTAFAEAIQVVAPFATHYESSQIIANLADEWRHTIESLPAKDDLPAINDWLQKICPIIEQEFNIACPFEKIEISQEDVKLYPEEYEKLFYFIDHPDAETKEGYRPLLQWMGGYFVKKLDDGIWYKEIVRLIRQDEVNGVVMCLVGGLRYPRDSEILAAAGGKVIGIERPSMPDTDSDDPTERHRREITIDVVVNNNGTLADLDGVARRLYEDVMAGKLKDRYDAA